MFDNHAFMLGGFALLCFAILTWIISVAKRDVSIVDSFWAPMFTLAFVLYLVSSSELGVRWFSAGLLVSIWAIRLTVHITIRNWGEGEDHRYTTIRQKYAPHFWFKSLFIIFVFQAVLAWILTLPLLAIITGEKPFSLLDYVAVILITFGICFEAIADWQLQRFRAQPANQGKVMNTGLWRYSRHPNYFGEFCIWWGFYLMAVAAGGWWSILSPLLMTFLLLKFSGVALLEQNITYRRPQYAEYIASTNAFFPGSPRSLHKGG